MLMILNVNSWSKLWYLRGYRGMHVYFAPLLRYIFLPVTILDDRNLDLGLIYLSKGHIFYKTWIMCGSFISYSGTASMSSFISWVFLLQLLAYKSALYAFLNHDRSY